MPRKNDLNRKLNEHGVFWMLDTPTERFPAKLKTDSRGRIYLSTPPTLSTIPEDDLTNLFGGVESRVVDEPIPVMHGIVGASPCTLFALHNFGPTNSADMQHMQAISYKRYQVSLCVLGKHITSTQEAAIRSAQFSYSSLKSWIRPKVEFSLEGSKVNITFDRDKPPIASEVSKNLCSYTFDVRPDLTLRNNEFRSRNRAVLEVKPSDHESVDWFWSVGQKSKEYFALLIGTSVRLESVGFKSDEDGVGWCRRNVRERHQKVNALIMVRPSSEQLGNGIVRWLEKADSFADLDSLLYDIRQEDIPVKRRFLDVAQGLEALHRMISNKKVGYKKRVEELISHLSSGFAVRLLGDISIFIANLENTRNYLTHPGNLPSPMALTDQKEQFLLGQKARCLLRFVTLHHFGLAEEVLAEPIYRQSRQWE